MDLFGMYADSDEEEHEEEQQGQSLPDGNDGPVVSGNGEMQAAVSCDDSEVSRPVAVDVDMVSVGGPPPAPAEEQDLPPPDPLEFLPQDLRDPPPGEPIPGISANVTSWLRLKNSGTQMAAALKQSRDFCNPYMMNMMIEYNQLDEYGSCYPSELWDPKGIPAEDYSRPLEREMKIQQRRLEQEQRGRNKVEFTSPGSDAGKNAAAAAAAAAVAAATGGALPSMASTQMSSMSAVAAATLAKAKAAAASISKQAQQQGQAGKPRRASKWDTNPLMKCGYSSIVLQPEQLSLVESHGGREWMGRDGFAFRAPRPLSQSAISTSTAVAVASAEPGIPSTPDQKHQLSRLPSR